MDVETAPVPPDFDLAHSYVLEGVGRQTLDAIASEVQLKVGLVLDLEERDLAQPHVHAVDLVSPEAVAVVRRAAVRE